MSVVNPAHLIEAIHLYPGSGEYIYEIEPVLSDGVNINILNDQNKANALLSLEQLQTTLPNLKYVSIIIDWFSTSLHANKAKIYPKVESTENDAELKVGKYTRKTAQEILYYENGELTYGGTPTDKSVVQICAYLKKQNYKVMIFPRLMVDDESLNKPWRGNIKPWGKKSSFESGIDNFFNNEGGYNNFILHYAKLEYNGIKLKNLIDSFVIGSELKDLTSVKVNEYIYPTIDHLKDLAKLVRNEVGEQVKITYGANWGEYSSPHMDQLWCDKNIDWVGISAYFPLTDNLKQEDITFTKIKSGWQSGEGIDFYQDGDIKVKFSDQAWAWKNVKHWWNSFHPDNTCWTPKQKPLIFTEYGFSSTEGTSNQPYLYYDANSLNLPNPSNYAQSLAIAASELFFSESNKEEANFLPWRFLYAWDARPFPAFPNNCNYWSDCNQYPFSHSINGKIELITIDNQPENLANEF